MPAVGSGRGGASGSDTGRLSSRVTCARKRSDVAYITPREVDLQQQRHCALKETGGHPPGGYLAICTTVRNQHAELPEWLDYHRRLGVSHVYVMDDASQPPLEGVLAPYIEEGLVTHRMLKRVPEMQAEIREATCHEPYITHKQLMGYAYCLMDYGVRHQWMAYIDIDEFFVFYDSTPDLPTLLHEYEGYGGLAVNWRMFGSSGHKKKQGNTLRAYTKCFAPNNGENTQIKTIANMQYLARMAGPHDAFYPPGHFTVNPSREPVVGPLSNGADYSRLALHHYAIKSREDFEEKMARGDVMGDRGKLHDFWDRIEAGSVDNCTAGVEMLRRLRRGKGKADKD
ncbi:hypothetical protein CHLNCDRAFT_142313 [Chlorella variabilis]|uniref:Glycosyltransferase family 92 protein n=1 Tax=Chlorella variabilis TaxID=554065 RepID=E1Z8A0_CHLVA|nr:hypothetical protein CHLNCDRAFT_142313 [Chlorella variabilis]EFN58057.1 hypothetical protein CHLNCDRAFT_142313 [Chlorella variabilis]|eukprot:XP_005850159.1 hypothetical protein CHLNCDRAFT_142313 [Chlorella variabilis]